MIQDVSLRDRLAMAAPKMPWSWMGFWKCMWHTNGYWLTIQAQWRYFWADAMMEARGTNYQETIRKLQEEDK